MKNQIERTDSFTFSNLFKSLKRVYVEQPWKILLANVIFIYQSFITMTFCIIPMFSCFFGNEYVYGILAPFFILFIFGVFASINIIKHMINNETYPNGESPYSIWNIILLILFYPGPVLCWYMWGDLLNTMK